MARNIPDTDKDKDKHKHKHKNKTGQDTQIPGAMGMVSLRPGREKNESGFLLVEMGFDLGFLPSSRSLLFLSANLRWMDRPIVQEERSWDPLHCIRSERELSNG